MTLTLIPDAEKTVSKYLREHADVAALNTRFVGKTPPDTSTSWVRVTELDATDQTHPAEHLIRYLLQLDVYAGETGGQPEVKTNARTIRAALVAMPGVRDDMVVTDVIVGSGPRRPDTDFEPARERVILNVQIWAHRKPGA